MSDVQQGPGWWQASDGRWYPPTKQGIAAGWYADPDAWGGQRYFDGREWTAHRVAPPARAVLPLTPEQIETRRKNRRVVLVLVGVLALALIVGGIVSAVRGPSAASKRNKAVEESCAGQLQNRVAVAARSGVQLTQREQTVFYDYCVDVGEGRVPTDRPDPLP